MEKGQKMLPATINWHQHRVLFLSGVCRARRDVKRVSLVTLKEDPPAGPHKDKRKDRTWH
jgi:hypothetical protein